MTELPFDACAWATRAPDMAALVVASVTVPVTDEQAVHALLKLLEILEDNDDVQRVQANFDIAAELIERLRVGVPAEHGIIVA